jgi:hypothetical protein
MGWMFYEISDIICCMSSEYLFEQNPMKAAFQRALEEDSEKDIDPNIKNVIDSHLIEEIGALNPVDVEKYKLRALKLGRSWASYTGVGGTARSRVEQLAEMRANWHGLISKVAFTPEEQQKEVLSKLYEGFDFSKDSVDSYGRKRKFMINLMTVDHALTEKINSIPGTSFLTNMGYSVVAINHLYGYGDEQSYSFLDFLKEEATAIFAEGKRPDLKVTICKWQQNPRLV